MNMPFGRFKGTPLGGLPPSYCESLLKQRISNHLRRGIEQVLGVKSATPKRRRPKGDAFEPTRWTEAISTEELQRWLAHGVKRRTRQAIERELDRRRPHHGGSETPLFPDGV